LSDKLIEGQLQNLILREMDMKQLSSWDKKLRADYCQRILDTIPTRFFF